MAGASTHIATKPLAVVDSDDKDFQIENTESLAAPPYIYKRLPSMGNHIRLLELSPGSGRSPIECKIVTHALESADLPVYSAVSYTRIDSKFDRLVISGNRVSMCDDLHRDYAIRHPVWCKGRRLLISTNLRDALRRFRHPTLPQTLWVDGLCINQEDFEERAQQVLIMQEIYRNACRVLLWLGEHDDHSELVLKLLARLQRIGKYAKVNDPNLPSSADLYRPSVLAKLKLPHFPSAPWKALVEFFERPVFRRIWVIQELVAGPRTVAYCGSCKPASLWTIISAARILNITSWADSIAAFYGSSRGNISLIQDIADIRFDWMQEPDVTTRQQLRRNLIRSTRKFEASDPRDKVFALICLVNDFGHREIDEADGQQELSASGEADKIGKYWLDLTLRFDAKGKTEANIAVEILHKSRSPDIAKLRRSLSGFLETDLRVVDTILSPSAGAVTERNTAATVRDAETNVGYLQTFHRDRRRASRNHERVDDFAQAVLGMLLHPFEVYSKFLAVGGPWLCAAMITPEIAEDVTRYREGVLWILRCLTDIPDGRGGFQTPHGSSASSTSSENRLPTTITSRIMPDSVAISIKSGHRLDDWAWSAAGRVLPDYRKPVEAVYTEFVVKCMQDDSSLEMLSLVEDRSERKYHKLPSWVPDFSVVSLRHQLDDSDSVGRNRYSATGSMKANASWSWEEPEVLTISGCDVDEIITLTTEASTGEEVDNQLEEWELITQQLPATYPTGEQKSDAFWNTLVGDRTFGLQTSYRPGIVEKFEDFTRTLANHNLSINSLIGRIWKRDNFLQTMATVMMERRLFVTKRGYFGAGPRSARLGDHVYLLAGGDVPYIVRTWTDGAKGTSEFIGECYVHGLMRGEALQREDFGWNEVRLR